MKKTVLNAMVAVALLMGGSLAAFAQEPCNSSCQAKEGFENIGEGAQQAAEGSYNTVKEGTVNTYEKAANGVETGWEKTKEGVETGWEKTKEGVETGWEKTKEGTVNLWNSAKEKIHNATE